MIEALTSYNATGSYRAYLILFCKFFSYSVLHMVLEMGVNNTSKSNELIDKDIKAYSLIAER